MSHLDDALERFGKTGFEYANGLSNHGPMAAEALQALGRASRIPALTQSYLSRLSPFVAGRAISRDEEAAAFARPERAADWLATSERELAKSDWRTLLRERVPDLIPGLFAAATHGVLRTAHAVRALEASENAVRRRELAFGLAYWTSAYQELPGRPGSRPEAGLGPADGLESLPLVEAARRRPGLFTSAAAVLAEEPAFAAAVARIDLDAHSPSEFLSELCACSAGLYLAHPEARIAYTHAVTAPSALRLLAPHLHTSDVRRALGFAFQAAAALHAISGRQAARMQVGPRARDLAERPDELADCAARSLQEHAIKLSEACLREDAIRPDARLRWTAADAALVIGAA